MFDNFDFTTTFSLCSLAQQIDDEHQRSLQIFKSTLIKFGVTTEDVKRLAQVRGNISKTLEVLVGMNMTNVDLQAVTFFLYGKLS